MMVERVARKLQELAKRNGRQFYVNWQDYTKDAKAILEVIQEPDWEMLSAVARLDADAPKHAQIGGRGYWRAMIAVVLEEGPSGGA